MVLEVKYGEQIEAKIEEIANIFCEENAKLYESLKRCKTDELENLAQIMTINNNHTVSLLINILKKNKMTNDIFNKLKGIYDRHVEIGRISAEDYTTRKQIEEKYVGSKG